MGVRDITQKEFFTDDKRFADLVNAVCFHGCPVLKPEELISVSESVRKADEAAVLERTYDVVKKQAKDGAIYAIYALENQTTVDYWMLIRVMVEECLAYDMQVKQIVKKNDEAAERCIGSERTLTDGEFLTGFHKEDKLTPVYTLVLYWGDKEWDGARSLRELVDIPEEDEELHGTMLELLPDYRIKVFDLNKEKDFGAFGTNLRTIFEFYAAGCSKQTLQDYMDTHEEEVEALDGESRFFLATMLGQKGLKKRIVNKGCEGGVNMCKAIDEMIEDGREEGRAEGRAEAEQAYAKERAEDKKIIFLLRQEIEDLRRQLSS